VTTARCDEWTGRVRRNELDQDLLHGLRAAGAESIARGEDTPQRTPMPLVGQEQVQEARARHLGPLERVAERARQLGRDALGDLARRGAESRCEQHRRVRRIVALPLAL